MRIKREDLFSAATEGLERLALHIGLNKLPDKSRLTLRQYRAELVHFIQRAEKHLERLPKNLEKR